MGTAGFEGVWEAFCDAGTTLGHTPGAREAWHQGRRRYAVWLLRLEGGAAAERVAELQGALAGRIRPTRADELHVTAFVAGFPAPVASRGDDVDDALLARTWIELQARPPVAPELVIGGVTAFRTCAVLEVGEPRGQLAALRGRLGRWAREVRFDRYRPHLTLGTFPKTVPVGPLVEALAPFRDLPALAWRPQALELVEFDARDGHPCLETRWRLPLV